MTRDEVFFGFWIAIGVNLMSRREVSSIDDRSSIFQFFCFPSTSSLITARRVRTWYHGLRTNVVENEGFFLRSGWVG